MPIIEGAQVAGDMARVAFRPPVFLEAVPKVWFMQVESQFIMAGITVDDTKYHAVVSALDVKTLTGITDLLETPPEQDKYETLKARVLELYAQSNSARLKLLFQDITLGDKRPSQLLTEMRSLAAGDIKDDVLKSLWLQRLPLSIQQILSISNDELTVLAKVADKIAEVSPLAPTVSAVSGSSELDSIKSQLAEIKKTLASLTDARGRERKRSFRGYRQRSVSRCEQSSNLCWYHAKFSSKAKKCIPPCKFKEN